MKNTAFIIVSLLMALSASAQDLCIGSFYVTSTDEESLLGDGGDKWAKRLPVIGDMFNFEQPDVLGLQSVTEAQLSQIVNRLTQHKAAGDILYSQTLELDTCGLVADMPEGSTCSWARLRKDGRPFYVFNMCLPTSLMEALTSANRVRTAAEEINSEGLPCFVVGFLGVNETKMPYTRLSAKFNDCYKSPVVSAEYGTKNDFNLAANHGTERYDFVFASKDVTLRAYGQLQYGYFTKEADGTYKRRLPSAHFPVMAKVTLKE